jgi:heavy-metal-associated domain-containing protein
MRAYLVHRSKGRVRLRIPKIRHNRSALQHVAERARKVSGVNSAEYNAMTGSVLIRHAPGVPRSIEDLVEAISDSGLPLELVNTLLEEEGMPDLSEDAQLAEVVMSFLANANLAIKQATGNQIDLKVLLPIAALGVGGLSLTRRDGAASLSTPLWLTLMLFAFSSFSTLHPHQHHGSRQQAENSPERYLH